MNIKIMENRARFEMSITMDDLKKVQTIKPNALRVMEEVDGEVIPVFTIMPADYDCFSPAGIMMSGSTRNGGKAFGEVEISNIDGDIKKYVAEKYYSAIVNIPKIERQIREAITEYDERIEGAMGQITIID